MNFSLCSFLALFMGLLLFGCAKEDLAPTPVNPESELPWDKGSAMPAGAASTDPDCQCRIRVDYFLPSSGAPDTFNIAAYPASGNPDFYFEVIDAEMGEWYYFDVLDEEDWIAVVNYDVPTTQYHFALQCPMRGGASITDPGVLLPFETDCQDCDCTFEITEVEAVSTLGVDPAWSVFLPEDYSEDNEIGTNNGLLTGVFPYEIGREFDFNFIAYFTEVELTYTITCGNNVLTNSIAFDDDLVAPHRYTLEEDCIVEPVSCDCSVAVTQVTTENASPFPGPLEGPVWHLDSPNPGNPNLSGGFLNVPLLDDFQVDANGPFDISVSSLAAANQIVTMHLETNCGSNAIEEVLTINPGETVTLTYLNNGLCELSE